MLTKPKAQLRADALEARRALSAAAVHEQSASIARRVMDVVERTTPEAVLTYVASKDNEVDTRPLITELLNRGILVLVPVAKKGLMRWAVLTSLDDLAPSHLGILEPEPATARFEEPTAKSICLVPGLLFTTQGHRVGYGGGYYDRFLDGYNGLSIGLAFEMQMVAALDTEPHDQAAACVVTESTVYRDGGTVERVEP